jgi:hypothetical protein
MDVNWSVVAVVMILIVLAGLYLSMTAGRLDRLHRRIELAYGALDVLLARRCAITLEISGSGLLDPATASVLIDSAHGVLAVAGDGTDTRRRWIAESDLTRTLGTVFDDPLEIAELRDDPGADELLDALAATCQRVALSRRFLNDGVRACRQVRKQRLVRWLRLAGRTPWPETVEMDDTPPGGLSALTP